MLKFDSMRDFEARTAARLLDRSSGYPHISVRGLAACRGRQMIMSVYSSTGDVLYSVDYSLVLEYGPAYGFYGRAGIRLRMRDRIGGDQFFDGGPTLLDNFMVTEIRSVGRSIPRVSVLYVDA